MFINEVGVFPNEACLFETLATQAQVRPEITEDLLEYAILYSKKLKDKRWADTFDAVCRIPPSGRLLKVVYKHVGKQQYKIITAYWLE